MQFIGHIRVYGRGKGGLDHYGGGSHGVGAHPPELSLVGAAGHQDEPLLEVVDVTAAREVRQVNVLQGRGRTFSRGSPGLEVPDSLGEALS